jgi:phage protein D
VTIKASSLAYGASVRQTKKTKAWENYSLSGIAKEIAGKGGLTCMYEAKQDPVYSRKEQTKKSDITFLSELCHDEGISLKVTDGKLVLFDQATYEAKQAVMTISRGGGRYVSYQLSTASADTQYGSCRVSYMDAATGKCIEATATAEGDDGDSEQCLEITAKVSSAGEAEALAQQQLRLYNKFNRTASFTMPGTTTLVAGETVRLEGFGGWNGKYMVKQAVHTVDEEGYTTKVELRMVLDRETEETEEGETYTVQSGDSLWKIAKSFYGNGAMYTKIYEANRETIGSNPGIIYPGQKLVIP